jgi:hypothetical protein
MLKKGYSGAGVYSKKNQTRYISGLAVQNSTLKGAMYVAILTTFRSFLSIAFRIIITGKTGSKIPLYG